jgi:hypothetical protein
MVSRSSFFVLLGLALAACGDGPSGADLSAQGTDLGAKYACTPECSSDAECQDTCAPTAAGASCCDRTTRRCFHAVSAICPTPVDLGLDQAEPADQSIVDPADLASAPPDLATAPVDLAHPDLTTVKTCASACTTHEQCANTCEVPASGRSCCDVMTNSCFTVQSALCPEPNDLGIVGPY